MTVLLFGHMTVPVRKYDTYEVRMYLSIFSKSGCRESPLSYLYHTSMSTSHAPRVRRVTDYHVILQGSSLVLRTCTFRTSTRLS